MERCSHCHHWSESYSDGWGICAKAKGRDGGPVDDTLAYADDVESYAANLLTLPNFGCVMFMTNAKVDAQ